MSRRAKPKTQKRDWRWWASFALNGAVALSMVLGTVFLFTGGSVNTQAPVVPPTATLGAPVINPSATPPPASQPTATPVPASPTPKANLDLSYPAARIALLASDPVHIAQLGN